MQKFPRRWQWIYQKGAVLAAGLLAAALFGWMVLLNPSPWLAAGAVLLAAAGWGLAFELSTRFQQQKARIEETERAREEDSRRFETLLRLNRGLIEADDEHALMDTSLSALNELVDALGCSFVPIDEWDQPLPAFTHGKLPEPVLRAWATHLTDGLLRQRCGSCSVLESTPGGCPLHPQQVGDALTVYCLPLMRRSIRAARESGGSRPTTLGVLHLYLPPGRSIDPRSRVFLDSLLQEIALAYENIHLRTQERSTLRHLQLLHAPESDLHITLGGLLDGLKQALEADFILIQLRPFAEERLNNLAIQRGAPAGLDEAALQPVFEQVLLGQRAASTPAAVPSWLALPLTLPEESAVFPGAEPRGRVLGMLLAGMNQPHAFHPRQEAILQTVAAQSALLVGNERMIRSLEYKVVIQERARLAREIHDGLAQTLAYLKLQSAQMQSYLAQGDVSRLALVLKENYHALAEAYLDTRQAIDNLRLTPQDGLETWIERITREFESATGVTVDRHVEGLPQGRTLLLSPEVQAQLIRIIQEALSNVRKHARAQTVSLNLREWQGELVIEVVDDGLGFDADDVPEVSQHGLRGMRERAELIGADFQIISLPRLGTTVRLVLPASLEEETQS
jgi:two-component system, NarL family, nitrate/nitrite sensor histidine kinase NarX